MPPAPLPGALAMVDIPGPTLDAGTAAHLRRHGIASVCLFGKNVQSEAQLRTLCADLQDLMGPNALIALDHEGGAILRPDFWPYAPSAMALGAADDPELTREVHAALARQLRAVGINWNFAPVLDVNVNPANPVIGERSFGADPQQVIRHGRASLEGHAQEGVAGCVKHFPGHGDTQLDSHYTLPRVIRTRPELEATDLAPFQALLDLAPAVMTAHIVFDALDGQAPATLSRPVLTGLLRQEWGYDGVIVTDSMGMKAIDDNFGRGEAAVAALRAGADLVMALGRREVQETTLEALARALGGDPPGALDAREIGTSLERLEALARRFPARADAALRPQDDAALMGRAWAAGLSPWRDPQPPAPGSRILLVAPRAALRENVSEEGVRAASLAADLAALYDVSVHAYEDPADLDWAELRQAGQTIVLATTGRHRHPALRGARPDLHLALYNPYTVLDVDAPALMTYGFRPEARAAVLDWLRRPVPLSARPPFSATVDGGA